MRSKWSGALVLGVLGCLLLLPTSAAAQAIAGQVTDNTGGVLPGVTAEAASSALIEGSRLAFTDGEGRYNIGGLQPGVYSITFSLPGFGTIVRDGIELTTGFTAPINVELSVGAIEESVTVSGESPVVDVQSATRSQVMTRELIEAVPTGRSLWSVGQTVPGVTMSAPDVGGTRSTQQTYMAIHGSNTQDNALQVDGQSIKSLESNGNWNHYHNTMMFQEINYETTGSTAETQGAGVRLNMIPKEGGNDLTGQVIFTQLPKAWVQDNVTTDLTSRGLKGGAKIDGIYDFNVGVGGPIVSDKWWFYSSARRWGNKLALANSFYNKNSRSDAARGIAKYEEDLARPTVDNNLLKSGMTRMTWQLASQHKYAMYLDRTSKFRGHEGGSNYAEEATTVRYPRLYYTSQAKYTGTLSSRLLLEAALTPNNFTWSHGEPQPSVMPTDVGRTDRSLGTRWSAPRRERRFRAGPRYVIGTALSYVTGSHSFKTGFTYDWGTAETWQAVQEPGIVDMYQEYRNGVPSSVMVYNTPIFQTDTLNGEIGLYAQDSWTIDRLTINGGVRLDWLKAGHDTQESGAGRFVIARSFPGTDNLPNWKDITPRASIAYDVRGDAKTALKASVGRYVQAFSIGFSQTYNPVRRQNDRRTWTDTNGDDYAQNDEIGAMNRPFDTTTSSKTRKPADGITRPYQWEYSVGLQQELIPGVSMTANWVRREFANIFWTDNELVSQSDFTKLSIAAPTGYSNTSGAALASGNIDVYTIDPALLGKVQEVDKNSNKNDRFHNGYDVGFNARIGGGNIFGGYTTTLTVFDTCDVWDPNELRYCNQSALGMPYRSTFKVAGTYPLPGGVVISGSLQSYAGGEDEQGDDERSQNANWNVTKSMLTGLNQSSVTVNLLQPGTHYLERMNQADIRFAKVLELGAMELKAQFDIFNMFNSNSVLSQNTSVGGNYDKVNNILPGRAFRIGFQADF